MSGIQMMVLGSSFGSAAPSTIEYLVVGGGAGGLGGGGGAGGFRTATGFAVSKGTTYTVTIGAGGPAQTTTNGQDSVFSTITSLGGGYSPEDGSYTATGGSGGGASRYYPSRPGLGTSGQGNNGGASYNDGGSEPQTGTYSAGGGGGAGAVGGNSPDINTGGNGGNGTASSITGSSVTYAGGGGGGGLTGGSGGSGGGAGGSNYNAGTGGANLGGGGGGIYSNGAGAGGSGVVIIRYADSFAAPTSTTGSPTVTVSGGYRIYKWTGSGSITW
jgi:hypothetical protein